MSHTSLKMAGTLTGKVALVTGAAGGIGLATVRALLKLGAKIGAVDISSQLDDCCKELGKEFGAHNITSLHCDVSDDDALHKVFEKTTCHFGALDIVVNNAGIADETNWSKTIAVNLNSVISGTYYGLELMSPERGGVIVNVSSMAGIHPVPFGPTYSATKHGVIAFTRSMKSMAAGSNVRINCICPYFVETQMGRGQLHLIPESIRSEVLSNGLLTPEEVADGIIELITDNTKNGAILRINPWQGKSYQRYKDDSRL